MGRMGFSLVSQADWMQIMLGRQLGRLAENHLKAVSDENTLLLQ